MKQSNKQRGRFRPGIPLLLCLSSLGILLPVYASEFSGNKAEIGKAETETLNPVPNGYGTIPADAGLHLPSPPAAPVLAPHKPLQPSPVSTLKIGGHAESSTGFGLKPGGQIGLRVSTGADVVADSGFGLKPPVSARKQTHSLAPLPPVLSAAIKPVMDKGDSMTGMEGMLGMAGMSGMVAARYNLLTPETSTENIRTSKTPVFLQELGATVFRLLSMPLMVAGLVVFGVCCFVLWRRALSPSPLPFASGYAASPFNTPANWFVFRTKPAAKGRAETSQDAILQRNDTPVPPAA